MSQKLWEARSGLYRSLFAGKYLFCRQEVSKTEREKRAKKRDKQFFKTHTICTNVHRSKLIMCAKSMPLICMFVCFRFENYRSLFFTQFFMECFVSEVGRENVDFEKSPIIFTNFQRNSVTDKLWFNNYRFLQKCARSPEIS